jgi:hypothetical protein
MELAKDRRQPKDSSIKALPDIVFMGVYQAALDSGPM